MLDTIKFTGDKNNIDDVVEFLNIGLLDGKKVSDIRKMLGMGEKAVLKLLKTHNYKFNQKEKKYIKSNTCTVPAVVPIDEPQKDYKETTENIEMSKGLQPQDNYKETTGNIGTSKGLQPQNNYKGNTEILEALSTVKELKEMTTKFNEMYNWYQLQNNVIDITALDLKIIKNDNDTVSRNMRLYIDTNKRLNDFCKHHKESKVQDIINTALVEFLDKYDK